MASVYSWKKDQIAQRYFIYSGNKKSQLAQFVAIQSHKLYVASGEGNLWRKSNFSSMCRPFLSESDIHQFEGAFVWMIVSRGSFLLSLFRYGIGDTTNGGLDQVVYVNIY